MNNPKSYVCTNNRFNTHMVLIFSDLNKAQIYKMPYRDSPHCEIEILMSFDYQKLFKPNEHTEDYYIRKPNDANFLFKIEDKKYIHVGEKLLSFETNDEIVKYCSEYGYNDIKYPYAYGQENIYFMSHQKYILIQEYEMPIMKNEYQYLYKRNEEITNEPERVDIVYGEDFQIVKLFTQNNENL